MYFMSIYVLYADYISQYMLGSLVFKEFLCKNGIDTLVP